LELEIVNKMYTQSKSADCTTLLAKITPKKFHKIDPLTHSQILDMPDDACQAYGCYLVCVPLRPPRLFHTGLIIPYNLSQKSSLLVSIKCPSTKGPLTCRKERISRPFPVQSCHHLISVYNRAPCVRCRSTTQKSCARKAIRKSWKAKAGQPTTKAHQKSR
jgi:hypothetical protein